MIKVLNTGSLGGTIRALAYAATAVCFDWGSVDHTGVNKTLWCEDVWERLWIEPYWLENPTLQSNPDHIAIKVMSIFKDDMPYIYRLWGFNGFVFQLMKEIAAGNIDHAILEAHDQHLYLDWYKEWEGGYYCNKESERHFFE